LYLGGASGVRAYPSGEGGGSEGHLLNLELRWKLAHGFTLTGFYDYGQVVVNRYNNYANSVVANAFSLKGRGLALIWNSMAGEIKAVWSQRDGSNPNPSATGSDQDGTQVRDRLWVSANLPF
jgi:hemolysin activation/secretion protein